MEKEQTTFDVQIGDGMDIGIMGENGEQQLDKMSKGKPEDQHGPKIGKIRRKFPPKKEKGGTIWENFLKNPFFKASPCNIGFPYFHSSLISGDVKNLKLTVGLNHYQAATIMSSFPNNMASFPNHNISEFPFNDSIRYSVSEKQNCFFLAVLLYLVKIHQHDRIE